jgi:hypothetical protein
MAGGSGGGARNPSSRRRWRSERRRERKPYLRRPYNGEGTSSNPPARGPGYSFRSGSHMSLNDAICGAVRIRPVPSASSSGSSCGGVLVVLARPSPPSSESTPLVARIADAKQLRSPRNAMLIRFSEDSSLVRASARRDEASDGWQGRRGGPVSAANQVSGVPWRASCRRSRFRYPFSGPIRLH